MPVTESGICVYRYGNTSSGSLWYALSYIESCQRVKKGETVWQVSHSDFRLARPSAPELLCQLWPCLTRQRPTHSKSTAA